MSIPIRRTPVLTACWHHGGLGAPVSEPQLASARSGENEPCSFLLPVVEHRVLKGCRSRCGALLVSVPISQWGAVCLLSRSLLVTQMWLRAKATIRLTEMTSTGFPYGSTSTSFLGGGDREPAIADIKLA